MSYALRGALGIMSIGEALLPKITLPSITLPIASFLNPKRTQEDAPTIEEKLSEIAENAANKGAKVPFFTGNGIYLAAPKKKRSHMKRRLRVYTPGSKHVKLKNELNRCPACGHYKRAHHLCMNCVSQIQQYWKQRDAKLKPPAYKEEFANPLDEQVLYPGKTERAYDRKLRLKDYLVKRPKTLPVEK